MKVLIVDDSSVNRTLMRNIAKTEGYQTVLAANGKEAWEIINNEKVDVILTDLFMTELNGFELIKLVRDQDKFKDIFVIAITATFLDEDEREFALNLGADEFISRIDGFDEISKILSDFYSKQTKTKINKIKITEEKFKSIHQNLLSKKLSTKILELEESNKKLKAEISERQKFEHDLTKSEELLKTIFNSSPVPLMVVDLESGNFLIINETAKEFHRITNNQIENYNLADMFVKPDMKETLLNNFSLRGNTKREVEVIRFNSNEKRWVEIEISEIEFHENKKSAILSLNDITKRREHEDILKVRDDNLITIFNTSPNPLAITDISNGKHLLFNNATLDFHKISREKLYDVLSYDIYVNIEDRAKILEKLKLDGKVTNQELEVFRAGTKEKRWVLLYLYPINFFGNKNAVIFSILDITDRKIADEELKRTNNLLQFHHQNSPLGYIEWDSEFRVKKWSKKAEEIFGWKAEELIGKQFREWDFVHTDDIESVNMVVGKLLSGEQTQNSGVNKNYTKDGEEIYCSWFNTALLDDEKKLIAMFSLVEDITERKLIEKRIKKSEKELIELNATKDKFFSILAHDLRSPFLALQGYSSLLLTDAKENMSDEAIEYSESINKTTKRIFGLLENLLHWARVQTGKLQQRPEDILLADLIDNSYMLLKSNADSKNIRVQLDYSPKTRIYCDKIMIDTVLRNLLSNAIKFTPHGGNISILVIEEDSVVKITVEDDGVGMDNDKVSKLFRMDEQVTEVGTGGEKGTGLGLILCKELVEKNNGKIWAESEPKKGSKFHLILPKFSN